MDNKLMSRKNLLLQKKLKISCIVPAYNEQAGIQAFLESLTQQLQKLNLDYEILVIDDGSRDHTREIVEKLVEHFPDHSLKLLSFSRNFGKEIALTAGLEHCQGDVAILIDADFQHPLDLIPLFLEKWSEGYDMVYGIRKDRKNETALKRVFSKVFYWLLGLSTNVYIPPNAGDYRLLDRTVINSLNECKERNRFMKGLYAWVGFKSTAVSFEVQNRMSGKSSWPFLKLTKLGMTGLTSFSDLPLQVWGFIGFIISTLSFSYALYIVFRTLIYGSDVPGYATIVVAIMFFGGIQLLSIGILGEYIARIFNEVKNRPSYIVARKLGFDDRSL